jgi:primase-polymerase (primpol)-like protein
VNPRNLANAGVHWANTWATFDVAYAAYGRNVKQGISGIGFVLTPEDPYVAVDIDNCVHGEEIEDRAVQVIEELKSYTEVSPSGHGLRIVPSSPEFHDNARTAATEVYSHSRYVTVTGHHVAGTPPDISVASADVIASLLPPPEQAAIPPSHARRAEQFPVRRMELWERILAHDKYGQQHRQRFYGDTSLDHSDHSFTVIRLLCCLTRWTRCDPVKMRSMMLMSPLANDKWFDQFRVSLPGGTPLQEMPLQPMQARPYVLVAQG